MEPKILPLASTLNPRYQSLLQDEKIINGFAEQGQQQGEVFIYKRPSFKIFQALGAGTARGLVRWQNHIYAIVNGIVFKDGVNIGTVSNAGTYTFTSCLGLFPKLFMQNGSNAYTIDSVDAITHVVSVNYPAATIPGAVYLDGTVYVMDANGTIFGSTAAANDPLTWDPLNTIKAQIEPTNAVFLAKQLVYLFALKDGYSEAFYDAGNATGSPLAPVQGAKTNFGCIDAGTVRDIGGDLIWVANSNEGYPCVLKVSSLKADIVSTPAVERILGAPNSGFFSWNARVEGHRFYGVTNKAANFTLVYDLTSNAWYQWTDVNGNQIPYAFSCATKDGQTLFLHATNGNLCTLDPLTFKDEGDAAFPVDIYTPTYDGGTRLTKVLHSLVMIGDQVNTNVLLRYSDDDGATWSAPSTIAMANDKPIANELGSFVKRIFRFTHQDNNAFRVKAVELFVSVGISP